MFKKGFIAIEAVIIAAVCILGGMAGTSAFLKNGQSAQARSAEAMNNTIDMIEEEFGIEFDAGEIPGDDETPIKKAPKSTVIKVLNQDGIGTDYTYGGQTMAFEDVEINTLENGGSYSGFASMNGTFTNCIINGTLVLFGDTTFIDCEFNISGDFYNVWIWGGANIAFENCTFYSDGKAVLLYSGADSSVFVKDCTFYDDGGLPDLKAAIEIANDYGRTYNLTVENTVVHGYEISDRGIVTGTTLWANKNSMGKDKLNVVVDGVDVY